MLIVSIVDVNAIDVDGRKNFSDVESLSINNRGSDHMSNSEKLKAHIALIDQNKDEIIAAIGRQRWFRLENTKTVIFDRDTNLLWLDHREFPYGKTVKNFKGGKIVEEKNKIPYPIADGYAEVREMLAEKNRHWLGNCMDWTIPTVDEFKQLIEDKTFPLLQDGGRTIKGKSRWCTRDGCINLDQDGAISNDDAFIMPCSHAYVPRAPKSTLDIFIDNQLDPIFDNGAINEIYRRLYNPSAYPIIRRPTKPAIEGFEQTDLLKYIAELEEQLARERERRPSFVFSLN